jgi:hypothetical protein
METSEVKEEKKGLSGLFFSKKTINFSLFT